MSKTINILWKDTIRWRENLPRKGYTSIGSGSLEDELIVAIDRLLKDPKFIAEMKHRGIRRVSRALVIRTALIEFLEKWGITDIYTSERK
jgi:hypothetical protein